MIAVKRWALSHVAETHGAWRCTSWNRVGSGQNRRCWDCSWTDVIMVPLGWFFRPTVSKLLFLFARLPGGLWAGVVITRRLLFRNLRSGFWFGWSYGSCGACWGWSGCSIAVGIGWRTAGPGTAIILETCLKNPEQLRWGENDST